MRRFLDAAVRLAGRLLMLSAILASCGIVVLAFAERRATPMAVLEAATEAAPRGERRASGPELEELRARIAALERPAATTGETERLEAGIAGLEARKAAASDLDTIRAEIARLDAMRAEIARLGGPAGLDALRAGLAEQASRLDALARSVARLAGAMDRLRAFDAEDHAGPSAATGGPRPVMAAVAAPPVAAAPAPGAAVSIHRRAGSAAARRAAALVAEEVRRAGLDIAAVVEEPRVPEDRVIRAAPGSAGSVAAQRLAERFRSRWGHAWQVTEAQGGGAPGLEIWLPHR